MRVLMISHSNLTWTSDYARYLRSRGNEVCVVSFSPEPIPGIRSEFVGVVPFDKYGNKHLFVTRVLRIRRIVSEFAPDVVFATYVISNGLSAVLSWSGPLVIDAVGGDIRDLHPSGDWRNAARRFIVRRVCSRASAVHAWSTELANSLVEIGVPASRIRCWPMGVDVDLFRPSSPPAAADRLICIRKHEPIYDIPTIIDALARLHGEGRRFACTFVGGGHLLEEHRSKVAACGLADVVRFTGPASREAIPSLLAQAGTFISASRADGASSSLLEAMASGLLPVVTRIPANTPWIEDGRNGLLFNPGQADQLADAIRRAMNDADLRVRAAVGNRERVVRDGNLLRNLERMNELLEAAASGAQRGAA